METGVQVQQPEVQLNGAMVKRRDLLLMPSLAALPGVAIGQSKHIDEQNPNHRLPPGKARQLNRMAFIPSVNATKIAKDTWVLAAMLAPLGRYRTPTIQVLIEVATDATFSQVVYERLTSADQKKSYRISHVFKSPYPTTELFFRFKTKKNNREKNSTRHVLTPVYSPIERISPWGK
jgi:phosphodiesterase/alkaline phosphatase D-like protein